MKPFRPLSTAHASRRPRPVLVRLPDIDPPFDDERVPWARPSHPSRPAGRPDAHADLPFLRGDPTALRRPAPTAGPTTTAPAPPRTPPRPAPSAAPTLVAAAEVPSWSEEADVGVLRTGTAALPPARRTASVLARALVEVLSGRRPVGQLRIHCSPEIYEGLTHRPPVPSVALPHLISVRVGEPADGVAEVCAVFRRAERVRAIAFRLAGVDGRWRVTALHVG